MNFDGEKDGTDGEVVKDFKKEAQETPSHFNTHLLPSLHSGNNIPPSNSSFKFLENEIFQDMLYNSSSKRLRMLLTLPLFKESLYNLENKESKAASPLHMF